MSSKPQPMDDPEVWKRALARAKKLNNKTRIKACETGLNNCLARFAQCKADRNEPEKAGGQ